MVPAAVTGISLLVVVLWIVGLIDLFRQRDTMSTSQLILWAVVIILIPFVGLIVYLFWRLGRSEAMADALSVPRPKPDLEDPPQTGRP